MQGLLNKALRHIKKLLRDTTIPPLEGDIAAIPDLREIHDEIKAIREILDSCSLNASHSPASEQVFPDRIKSLRNEMEHRIIAMEALQESESRFKYLANHDPLTEALNRRSFMERAVQELTECFRHSVPCGLIMLDIDNFKIFNDTHGHIGGDEALRHLVKVITDISRKHDFLGRYGGEEFVFFYCHADKSQSYTLAERIRGALENSPVPLKSGPAPMTASFGVAAAEFPPYIDVSALGDYLETLLSNADKALYQAKREGKNRVTLFNKAASDEHEG